MNHKARTKTAATWFVVLLLCVMLGGGWLAGLRAHYLMTPSMGTALPVGSLAVTAPAAVEEVAVGDVVTTRLKSGATRTHRVVEKEEDGLVTQGDINGGVDVGLTTDSNMVGQVVWSAPALGWGVRMLPWILGMWVVMWVVSRPLEDSVQRSRYRVVGVYLGFSLSLIVIQPLLGMSMLGIKVEGSGEDSHAVATVVSTGLLPIKLVPAATVEDDDSGWFPIRLTPPERSGTESEVLYRTGETGEAVNLQANEEGEFAFIPTPVFTWPAMVAALGLVVSPWIWFFLQYRRHREVETTEEKTQPQPEEADL